MILRQAGTHHFPTLVAQEMVPFLGMFPDDVPVDKLLEHHEDVSEPRGAQGGRMVSFTEERAPSEPGPSSTRLAPIPESLPSTPVAALLGEECQKDPLKPRSWSQGRWG